MDNQEYYVVEYSRHARLTERRIVTSRQAAVKYAIEKLHVLVPEAKVNAAEFLEHRVLTHRLFGDSAFGLEGFMLCGEMAILDWVTIRPAIMGP